MNMKLACLVWKLGYGTARVTLEWWTQYPFIISVNKLSPVILLGHIFHCRLTTTCWNSFTNATLDTLSSLNVPKVMDCSFKALLHCLHHSTLLFSSSLLLFSPLLFSSLPSPLLMFAPGGALLMSLTKLQPALAVTVPHRNTVERRTIWL